MDKGYAIEVDGLVKEFEYYKKEEGLQGAWKNLFYREKLSKRAVNEISFRIKKGEMVAFMGPNGAGKTTTLKMLSGILYPTQGTANVLGYVPWKRNNDFKKQISIVMGQKNQLWWDLPAMDSFILTKKMYEIDDKIFNERLYELVKLLEVEKLLNVQVRRLSLGERMKMELIAALLYDPAVVFLDEPTIGLDVLSQRSIREFLKKYNEEKKATIILTSHYMEDVVDLCKRSIIINEGRIVFDDDTDSIRSVLGNKKIISFNVNSKIKRTDVERFGKIKEWNASRCVIVVPESDARKKQLNYCKNTMFRILKWKIFR
jgi:ABC-2 type transport system ATP-binding protein